MKKSTKPSSPITAAEARQLAARHALKKMFTGARVCDGSKVRLRIYEFAGRLVGKPIWVFYPNPAEDAVDIKDSEIIIVCQRSGKILFAGSAQDEG